MANRKIHFSEIATTISAIKIYCLFPLLVFLSCPIYLYWIYRHVLNDVSSPFLLWIIAAIRGENATMGQFLDYFSLALPMYCVIRFLLDEDRSFPKLVRCACICTVIVLPKLLRALPPDVSEYVVAALPPLMAAAALYYGCKFYSHPWSNGTLSNFAYRVVEGTLRLLRFIIYVTCATLLVLNMYPDFRAHKICTFNALVSALPLLVSFMQSFYRITFRRWPNYALSTACIILYLALLLAPYDPDALWGFSTNLSEEKILYVIHNLPSTLKNSVIAASIFSVFNESLINLFTTLSSSKPANLAQNRCRNRRRLLTHWGYTKDGTMSSRTDSITWLAVVLCLFILFSCWVTLNDSMDPTYFSRSRAIGDSTELTYSSQEQPPVLQFFSCSFTFDGSDSLLDSIKEKNSSELSLSLYLVIIATIICVPGLVSLWNISEDRLIQSEYFYLTYRSSQLKDSDIINTSNHWQDYCQVFVNMYSNVSGLTSEDEGYHKLSGMLGQMHRYLTQNSECASIKFFGDILSAKGDVNSVLLRELEFAKTGDSADDASKQAAREERLAQDALMANDFIPLLDQCCQKKLDELGAQGKSIDYLTCDPLLLIHHLNQQLFHDPKSPSQINTNWRNRLSAHNISAQEGVKLLKMDALIHILQREDYAHCGFCWLGCPNSDDDKRPCSAYKAHALVNRLELILTYPFIVFNCYQKRWTSAMNSMIYEETCRDYICGIHKSKIYVKDIATIAEGADRAWHFMAENNKDAKDAYMLEPVLTDVVPVIPGQMKRFLELDSDKNQLARNQRAFTSGRKVVDMMYRAACYLFLEQKGEN